jgi:RHS repeat-associated protein
VNSSQNLNSFGGQSYGFTGLEHDESGLVYARNRYYHPQLGRFISQDPIGFAGGLNLYAYCSNDPINFTDPLGLFDVGMGDVHAAEASEAETERKRIMAMLMNGGPVIPDGLDEIFGDAAPAARYGLQYAPDAAMLALRGGRGGKGGYRGPNGKARAYGGGNKGSSNKGSSNAAAHAGENYEVESYAKENSRLNAARDARDKLVAQYRSQGLNPSTVTGGYDPLTGRVAAAKAVTGACAEDEVRRMLGTSSVIFTEAIRPRHLGQQPICERCQSRYHTSQFPFGTKFQ